MASNTRYRQRVTSRSDPQGTVVPRTAGEASALFATLSEKLRLLSDVRAKHQRRVLKLDALMAKWQGEFTKEAAPLIAEAEALATLLLPYLSNNREQLTNHGEKKSATILGGHEVRWRTTPERVVITDQEGLYTELEEAGLYDEYVRQTPSPDKEKLGAKENREEVQGLKNITFVQDEVLVLEPANAPTRMQTVLQGSPQWELKSIKKKDTD